jgi:hypothetical protein
MYDIFSQAFVVVFMVVYSAIFAAVVAGALKLPIQGAMKRAHLLASAPAGRKVDTELAISKQSAGRTQSKTVGANSAYAGM